MRRNKGKRHILSDSLNDLIVKFSQHDVIAEMEKEYQSAPTRLIPISLIDDTEILSSVEIPEKVVDYFAEGLREKGLYNPLVVRARNNRFEIILGRKRFFGAKRAGILSLPCAVLDIGDEEMLLMLLADARDQRDNNVLELALVCNELATKFDYPQKTLAEISHQSRSQITNILRVLKLSPRLQKELAKGSLSYGHARALAGLPADQMEKVADECLSRHLSVHQLEEYLRSLSLNEGNPENAPRPKVVVSGMKITVEASTPEEKERIFQAIQFAVGE